VVIENNYGAAQYFNGVTDGQQITINVPRTYFENTNFDGCSSNWFVHTADLGWQFQQCGGGWLGDNIISSPLPGCNLNLNTCCPDATCCTPTAITLSSFDAKAGNGLVTLNWTTESEINNSGFNIYRAESENGQYIKINTSLIPTKGSSTQGASYEFVDTNVQNRKTYYYKLEDIDLSGTSTMHGPVSAMPRLLLGIFNDLVSATPIEQPISLLPAANAQSLSFTDDFSRTDLAPWVTALGTWTITGGVLQGSGDPDSYSYAYYYDTATMWTDYTVQGEIQIPAGSYGGGIGGRVDPATGTHYGAWVYPAGSAGGSNVLKLWKFRSWTSIDISASMMQQVSLPDVGTGWHTLKITFTGNHILVYYDGSQMIDVTDINFDSRPAYLSGGISADWYTMGTPPYTIAVDNISVTTPGCAGVAPASATKGATLDVTITGVDTNFEDGLTAVSFMCAGNTSYITVNGAPIVNSITQTVANITIASNAPLGACDVIATTNLETITCTGAFTINVAPVTTTTSSVKLTTTTTVQPTTTTTVQSTTTTTVQSTTTTTVQPTTTTTAQPTTTTTSVYPTNQPPDCAKAYASPDCLWPPNNKMVPVNIMGVTDPDGDPVTITITSVTSDEPTSTALGAGGPKAAPDASGVGSSSAMIRAERSGNGDGRVYVINFTGEDGKGGMCNASVVVKVPHDQSSKSCPAVDSGQKYDATKIN
jgi:hypothetical protein